MPRPVLALLAAAAAIAFCVWPDPLHIELRRMVEKRAPASASVTSSGLMGGHSHNDYEQERPLWDALMNRFHSIEADIWLKDRDLLISHLGITFKGSLRRLYLNPLQARVRELGSVYGDGKPVILWLDIKDRDPRLVTLLQETLSHYPMLSVFTSSGIDERAVTVILTGNRAAKAAYARNYRVRYATRDSLRFDPSDPPAAGSGWLWYSIRWGDYFDWDGSDAMPAGERELLRTLVASIHAKGRRVRIWGAPDTESVWSESAQADVDLIGTDSLERFAKFWKSFSAF